MVKVRKKMSDYFNSFFGGGGKEERSYQNSLVVVIFFYWVSDNCSEEAEVVMSYRKNTTHYNCVHCAAICINTRSIFKCYCLACITNVNTFYAIALAFLWSLPLGDWGGIFLKHFKDFKHPFFGKLSGTIFMGNSIMFKLRIIVITNQDYHAAGFLRFYPLFCVFFLMLAYAGGIWVCFSIYPDFRASDSLWGASGSH